MLPWMLSDKRSLVGAASHPRVQLSVPFSAPPLGSSDVCFFSGLCASLHNHLHKVRLPKGPHCLRHHLKKELLLGF